MDGKHPKRRKDKYNPYKLVIHNGTYYISFKDGQGVYQRIEINKELYTVMDSFEREDLAYLNEVDRHIEQFEITDEEITMRSAEQPELTEDIALRNMRSEHLHQELDKLPGVQRRRVILHYFYGFTYEEIAKREGCTVMPVKRSIDQALKKIKSIFQNRG